MFQGIFPPWAGENDTASAISSSVSRQTAALAATTIIGDDDEAKLADIDNDDELASRLLVQFPTYGTRTQALNNNLNQTADWLLGGTSNIPNQQQLLKQQQLELQQQQAEDHEDIPLPANTANNANPSLDDKQQPLKSAGGVESSAVETAARTFRDWDEDEQQLWRKTSRLPTKPNMTQSRNKSTRTDESKEDEISPAEHAAANEWLMAYYYHTGVTPKFEPRRHRLTFEQTSTTSWQHQQFRSSVSNPIEAKDGESEFIEGARKQSLPPHTRTTAFRRISSIEVSEDEEDFFAIRPMTRSLTPPTSRSSPDTSEGAIDDRQHWMPDRLCKYCYSCDSPFTFLRRRHHCRICGQVFCNTCSGYFVPASNKDPSNKTILRTCKMCFDQVTEQQKQIEDVEAADAGRKRKKKEEPLTSPEPKQGGATAATSVSPTLQEQLEKGDSVLQSLSKKRSESAFTKRLMASQQNAIEQYEKEQTSQILQTQNQSDQQNPKTLPPSSESNKGIESSTSGGAQLSHPSSASLKSDADRNLAVQEGNVQLGLTAASHLEQLGDGLLETDAPLLRKELLQQCPDEEGANQLYRHWLNKLMSLATRCCSTVDPNLKKGDLLDIRPYVKIKGKCNDKI